jgi:disulfide bond formation protein DsbB
MLDVFPLLTVVRKVLTGGGECAKIDWSFLGLSMPAWVLAALCMLAAWGLWANLRRLPRPQGGFR